MPSDPPWNKTEQEVSGWDGVETCTGIADNAIIVPAIIEDPFLVLGHYNRCLQATYWKGIMLTSVVRIRRHQENLNTLDFRGRLLQVDKGLCSSNREALWPEFSLNKLSVDWEHVRWEHLWTWSSTSQLKIRLHPMTVIQRI